MIKGANLRTLRKRRTFAAVVVVLAALLVQVLGSLGSDPEMTDPAPTDVLAGTTESLVLARDALQTLEVKGRAPKTGYSRSQFSDGWASLGRCDVRNAMLGRDLTDISWGTDGCTVLSGMLVDPYSGEMISFVRGSDTSDDVQIDHVVALSDAWQKGAQALSPDTRLQFSNDPLNLLAVRGDLNQQKGDSDAASWLPPNKDFRCRYVARQTAVKQNYSLWITEAEKAAMERVLNSCPEQPLPLVEIAELLE